MSAENPAGYAWMVLRNCTIDVHRRGRRALPLEMTAFETASLVGTADPIGQFGESSTLVAAIRELPPRQMDVMVLRYLLDYTDAQVAEELGITPAGVRSTAATPNAACTNSSARPRTPRRDTPMTSHIDQLLDRARLVPRPYSHRDIDAAEARLAARTGPTHRSPAARPTRPPRQRFRPGTRRYRTSPPCAKPSSPPPARW